MKVYVDGFYEGFGSISNIATSMCHGGREDTIDINYMEKAIIRIRYTLVKKNQVPAPLDSGACRYPDDM